MGRFVWKPGTVVAAILVIAAAVAGDVKLTADNPLAAPPKSGTVCGTLAPAGKVASVELLSRVTGKSVGHATLDKRTGTFTVADVGGDARYDVRVRTTDGRTYEGIDLDFVDARLLRLAKLRRKQLGLPAETFPPFTGEDVKRLTDFVAAQKTFTHIHRPLQIHGDGGRAVVLLELIRTKPFVASKGKMVWRVELWYFRKAYGGWEKAPNTERVLRRERIAPEQWRKIHIEYLPELSVYVGAGGGSKPLRFTIPDKPDSSRGRCPNTPPELHTLPHVSGLTQDP